MIWGRPSMERDLRRRVWSEVRRSERLWEEYWPILRRRRVSQLLAVGAGAAVLVPGSFFFIVAHSAAFLGVGLFLEREPQVDPRVFEGNGPELTLLSQALALVAWVFLFQTDLWKSLWRSRRHARVAFLPLSDNQHFKWWLLNTAGVTVFYAAMTLPTYGYLAWSHRLGRAGWSGAAALGFLQSAIALASTFLLVGRLPTFASILLGVSAGLSVVGFMCGFLLRPYLEGLCWLGFLSLPTGWVNGAFYYGLLLGHPTGWLWLLPVPFLFLLTHRRLAGHFAIREFTLLPTDEVEAEPEASCAHLKGRFRPPLPYRKATLEPVVTVSEEDAEQKARERSLRAGFDWQRLGWIERLYGRWLTPRERAIAEMYLGGRPPRWSLWWKWMLAVSGSVLTLLSVPAAPDWISFLAAASGAYAFFALLLLGPDLWNRVDRGYLPGPVLWPVAYGELVRVHFKARVLGCLILTPFLLAFGAVAAWRCGYPVGQGLFLSSSAVCGTLVYYPWLLLFSFSATTNDTSAFARYWPGFLLVFSLAAVACFAGLCYFALRTPLLMLASASLAWVASAGALRFYLWVLHRTSVDWIKSATP